MAKATKGTVQVGAVMTTRWRIPGSPGLSTGQLVRIHAVKSERAWVARTDGVPGAWLVDFEALEHLQAAA